MTTLYIIVAFMLGGLFGAGIMAVMQVVGGNDHEEKD